MIRIKLGIVLKITDGFTGMVPDGRGFRFLIDGRERRAMIKPDGYYVFTEVAAGSHDIRICSVQYREEVFTAESGTDVIPVALKPGKTYGFAGQTARRLTVKCAGRVLWTAQNIRLSDIKLTQDGAAAGSAEMKLYFDDAALKLPLPGYFLVQDGEQSEIVLIDLLEKDGISELYPGQTFRYAHKRGCRLYPAQMHRSMGEDSFDLVLRKSDETWIFDPLGAKCVQVEDGVDKISIGS